MSDTPIFDELAAELVLADAAEVVDGDELET